MEHHCYFEPQNEFVRPMAEARYPERKRRNAAFTLAEVLITLGIIGMVAAITLPSLINEYQKHSTVNQLKAAYQIFSEIIECAKADHNAELIINQEMLNNSQLYGNNWLISKAYFEPYITSSQQTYLKRRIPIKNASRQGTAFLISWPNVKSNTNPVCISSKGLCYWIYMSGGVNNANGKNFLNYIRLVVDLNGPKGPNVLGRDVFLFNFKLTNKNGDYYITGLSVNFPYGYKLTDDRETIKQGCNKTSTDMYNGIFCSVLIVKDDWKISDDYPW